MLSLKLLGLTARNPPFVFRFSNESGFFSGVIRTSAQSDHDDGSVANPDRETWSDINETPSPFFLSPSW